ncbi:MAG: M48 family metallopeptidase [Bdellovibrionales bacterium]|nr:M48 family metallopeptidase [Oligoflexia bacterium]
MNSTAPSDFRLIMKRTPRRKTVAIQVFPDGKVVVLVPLQVSDAKVEQFLKLKRCWIERTLLKFASLGPQRAPPQFVPGEAFLYLGEERKLSLFRIGTRAPEVDDANLHVFLPANSKPELERSRIRSALELWYKAQAETLCKARVAHFSELMGLLPKSIQIKSYKTRWGTCKSTGEVTFNWRLAMVPLSLLDYVVIHELAHLKYHNHGAKFWQLVKIHYPDPEAARKALQLLDHRGALKL